MKLEVRADGRKGRRLVGMIYTEEGEQIIKKEIDMPARWQICDGCDGNEMVALQGMAFTAADFAEDPEFAEGYFSGHYDRACVDCDGTGKIYGFDFDATLTEEQEEALKNHGDWCAEEAADLSTRRMESGGIY